jgi:hypothetical protein
MNGATSETRPERTRRRGVRVLAPAVATALFGLLLLVMLPGTSACMAPCQRHSDCRSPWICNEYGACEAPPVDYPDPIDAGNNSIPGLHDGALDDSDLGDPPPDADVPDADLPDAS